MSRLRGRFDGPVDEAMLRFSSSLDVDLRMFDEEVDASIAHAEMLGRTGILAGSESEALSAGLEEVRREFHGGRWRPDPSAEDLHMALEERLIEKLGDIGRKLHTARSRNDQVATDVRLWLKRALGRLDSTLTSLIEVLLDRVESDGKTLMPGYTHLQRGQPIWLGHQLLAHAWALSRDRERVRDAVTRVDRSPLGACALGGTPHPIDRDSTARRLGFAGPVENAMDAVAARDHLQESAAACAICMTHLSRMAEELVLWSSAEFDFVRVDDAYTTGSSIMPQKRNPDAAELIRGKTGRVYGDLQALLVVVKAMPMAYNRDLQEDKEPLIDALDTTTDCVEVMREMWQSLVIRKDRFEKTLREDFTLATELADLLVARGVAFREAHEVVGRIVRDCETRGAGLDRVTPESAAAFHDALSRGFEDRLDPRAAVERRTSRGGTAWSEIERQVVLLRKRTAC